jgi:predicted ATPase
MAVATGAAHRRRSVRTGSIFSAVELLERDEALGALTEAHEAAARGDGRVIVVTGEAGIGKTALVATFLGEAGPGARVLVGTCDDLSIPRPLGPLHDLAGSVSPELEQALAGGARPEEIHGLLLTELRRPPAPAVLVLEDIHWADEATLDVITVLARRISSLPLLLVLTCRDGEARFDHPVHAAVSASPSSRSRRPRSPRSQARTRERSTPPRAATRST